MASNSSVVAGDSGPVKFKLGGTAVVHNANNKRSLFVQHGDDDIDGDSGSNHHGSVVTEDGQLFDSDFSNKRQKVETPVLVIPLQKKVLWRPVPGNVEADTVEEGVAKTAAVVTEKGDAASAMSLHEQAVNELLADASKLEQNGVGTLENMSIPILMQNRAPGTESLTTDDEKFRLDVLQRPEEATLEAYEATPIHLFGEALLRGMGWQKGEAIGGVNKGLAKPVEYVPRFDRRGLGAQPKPPQDESKQDGRKKILRPGESRDADRDRKLLVAAPSADGRARHVKDIDEKLVVAERSDLFEGGYCVVNSGPHRDLYGKVCRVDEVREKTTVELTLSGEKIDISLKYVTPVSKGEYQTKSRLSASSKSSKPGNESHGNGGGGSTRPVSHWLRANIRVKVVSRDFKEGKYYLKKITVLDVTEPGRCSCRDEDGRHLENVKEADLETVIPSEGDRVTILRGKTAGRSGVLIEKNREKARGVVRLVDDDDDDQLVTCSFDDISQQV